jgi:hypothetical protein
MSRGEIIEWLLMLLAIASIWPWVLGYRPDWYRLLLVVVLALMLWVTLRRVGRVRTRR